MSRTITTKTRLALAALAALAGLTVVAPAARAAERPFHLVEQGTATFDGLNVTSTGTGEATHLGRFTLERSATLYDPNEGVFEVDGEATLVAANGDELDASIEGTLDTNNAAGLLIYEWEGGTGRFEDATGTTIWHVTVHADGTYSVIADGVIDY